MWLEAYIEAVSFRRIATIEQLQLEQTHKQTDTQSALQYPLCGYTSIHNNHTDALHLYKYTNK